MISQLAVPLAATLLCYVAIYVLRSVYREWTSPLRHVGGPKSRNRILGNFKQMMDDPELTAKWRREFGSNFRFKGLFNRGELHTTDLKAIHHIATNAVIYQRAPFDREATLHLLGKGINIERTQGLRIHPFIRQAFLPVNPKSIIDRQRRILNPAFGVPQIRDLTEIFIEKAIQLRDIWALEVAQKNGAARVDALSWLRRATLDVIGAAVFSWCK
ncbi:hypothetical protein C8R43DRAFT_1208626 [Mycena crocata]|nr:hypothetical protein C8R43DRAFT_1208626 [Mycena crocata]